MVNAHEFSNDLTVIIHQCDVLVELSDGNPEAGKHLRLIRQAVLHMTDRIEDLHQFHKKLNVFRSRSELQHVLIDDNPAFCDGSTLAAPAINGS